MYFILGTYFFLIPFSKASQSFTISFTFTLPSLSFDFSPIHPFTHLSIHLHSHFPHCFTSQQAIIRSSAGHCCVVVPSCVRFDPSRFKCSYFLNFCFSLYFIKLHLTREKIIFIFHNTFHFSYDLLINIYSRNSVFKAL